MSSSLFGDDPQFVEELDGLLSRRHMTLDDVTVKAFAASLGHLPFNSGEDKRKLIEFFKGPRRSHDLNPVFNGGRNAVVLGTCTADGSITSAAVGVFTKAVRSVGNKGVRGGSACFELHGIKVDEEAYPRGRGFGEVLLRNFFVNVAELANKLGAKRVKPSLANGPCHKNIPALLLYTKMPGVEITKKIPGSRESREVVDKQWLMVEFEKRKTKHMLTRSATPDGRAMELEDKHDARVDFPAFDVTKESIDEMRRQLDEKITGQHVSHGDDEAEQDDAKSVSIASTPSGNSRDKKMQRGARSVASEQLGVLHEDVQRGKPTVHNTDSFPPLERAHGDDDEERMLPLVSKRGFALRHASDRVRGMAHVVQAAVQQNPAAMWYAAPSLKADRSFILERARENSEVFQFACDTLRSDKDLVLELVQVADRALHYAALSLKKDDSFILSVMQTCGMALQYQTYKRGENADIVFAAVTQNGMALQFAPTKFKSLMKIVRAAVKQNGLAVQFMQPVDMTLAAIKEIALEAVQQNPAALEFLPGGRFFFFTMDNALNSVTHSQKTQSVRHVHARSATKRKT